MTVRHEMFRAARRGAESLGGHTDRLCTFVCDRFTPQGFRGRSHQGDLYYTVFALESLLAVAGPVPTEALTAYLQSFATAAELDLVHTACLARCWAALPDVNCPPHVRDAIAQHIVSLTNGRNRRPTAYECFLTLAGLQDLGHCPTDPETICQALTALKTECGGYANHAGAPLAATASTSAAMVTLTHLGQPTDDRTVQWLLDRYCPSGGFSAIANAPVADLLSTAIALHALSTVGADLPTIRDACHSFVLSLGDASGGFRACDEDPTPDVEYTWYALLALGHLGG